MFPIHFRHIRLLVPCLAIICIGLSGCVSSRHVPEGGLLLDQVKIRVDSTANGPQIDTQQMEAYLRQEPNHRMLWSIKFRLGFYNLSGNDTTKFWNRWVRRLGEPPVVYDSALTAESAEQLRKVLVNKGYLKAAVKADTIPNYSKRKVKVNYTLSPGEAYTIDSIAFDIADKGVDSLISSNLHHMPVSAGAPLDRNLLEEQRQTIYDLLRNHGYFAFKKEDITFVADTTYGSTSADLTMKVSLPKTSSPEVAERMGIRPDFDLWHIRRVIAVTDYDPATDPDLGNLQARDTINYKGLEILYGAKAYLRPKVIYENCFLSPGQLYTERSVDRTYQSLSRLQILKFINVRLVPAGRVGDTGLLDAYVLLTPGKPMTASLELEGTNSAGDLGVAVGLGFTHRNIGRGSETLSAKLTGSYEALSGDFSLDNLIHNRYMEYGADFSLTFPRFVAPFLTERFKRNINASSGLNITINYQERPEYTRIISTAGWFYKWSNRRQTLRQTLTPIDVNYVYLPRSTYEFLDRIAPDNPLLRYSYEDHFIMRMGYNLYYTNRRQMLPGHKAALRDFFTLRANAEVAGNVLFGLSNLFEPERNFTENPYKLFGIRYSQYVRFDGDWSYLKVVDWRNSVAFHIGGGIGIPYGNSTILPFEKRFYGGGANGVRGWAVRTLGPGSFPGVNSVSDFINQCGDIRLEFNAEYRAKLFWVLELGAFVDVGNIWTIRSYENQPGGVFRFNRFYEQFAGAYGLGLRMDFDYFLIRFDLGMKAFNPASGERRWPLVHPQWHRDSAFHFSIGYPF